LPGLKAGTFDAAISIFSFVAGLNPERAAQSRRSNVPKPISCTEPPDFDFLFHDLDRCDNRKRSIGFQNSKVIYGFNYLVLYPCNLIGFKTSKAVGTPIT
jgi:hypothetical protein